MEERKTNQDFELFRALYMENAPKLTFFACKFVSVETAEDLIQDIFLKIWYRKVFLLSREGIRTYLYSAVKNGCLDYLKHQGVERNYVANAITNLKIEELSYFQHLSELFEEDERIALIYNEIGKLPEKCKEIFILSYLDEKKSEEIAEILHLSKRTVEAQLYKALKYIRTALKVFILLFASFCT